MIQKIKNNASLLTSKLDVHTRSVLKKSAASTVVKATGMLISVVVSIFIGRTIGADGLGIITLSHKVANILIAVGLLGIYQVIIKEVAIAHNKNNFEHIGSVINTAYWLNGLFTLVLSVIFILLSPWLANNVFHEPRLTYPLMITLVVSTPQVFSRIYSAALIGYHKIWQSNLVNQALSIAVTGGLLFAAWLSQWTITLNMVAVTYAIGWVFVTLSVGMYWRTLYTHDTKSTLIPKQLLVTSMPLFWVTVSTMVVTSSSAVILGWLESSKNVGIFTTAARIALLTSFLLQVTNAAISPKLAALYESNKKEEMEKMVQRITLGLGIIGLFQTLFLVVAGRYILSLWGNEFEEGYWILIILSVGQLFNIGTGAADTLLVMCGQEKIQKNISIIFMCFNLVSSFIFIKYYGIYGAAVATALTVIGQNITRLILAKTKIGISTISIFK
ncbi:lipopolysaccharide biosynthesis protein [Desulforapulum autotrophicum HRM2]|uniref:Lipopolysaccharide biosynthesis protein n=1 Tax=Desulforapulum autotrophicum (strain ATCC 43914 / DSM 3382 / VKM B-1955 / HRM2) TaxID=177437 RepID=C0QGX4_DESAH|nr:oligosaccharide flippase family protein [Desulforapulum autotrophicum]ACN15623.1 lipopolysaccharide biosynthesis protein [Desulforapulum autotrophicum HRM2]